MEIDEMEKLIEDVPQEIKDMHAELKDWCRRMILMDLQDSSLREAMLVKDGAKLMQLTALGMIFEVVWPDVIEERYTENALEEGE